MATLRHSETLLLENYVRIVALAPDLQKVSFYSAIVPWPQLCQVLVSFTYVIVS